MCFQNVVIERYDNFECASIQMEIIDVPDDSLVEYVDDWEISINSLAYQESGSV